MKKFKLGTEIYYGNGIKYLENLKCNKVFIITDNTMLKIGIVKKVTDILDNKNIEYKIFKEVEPNPSLSMICKGLKLYCESGFQPLISIGGGSVIDTAKAIIYFLKKGLKIKKDPLFIAIPTTSGTGSEVTSYSIVTDEKTKTKLVLIDDSMHADVAILDSQFTMTVPDFVTADTGMDVLAHGLEAYVSNKSSPFTDMLALTSIKEVFNSLEKVYINGNDKISRDNMHNASCMAGVAFENASLGLNHSMAHALGAKFNISHGRANAVLLPYVIEYNSGVFDIDSNYFDFSTAEKYSKLSKELGYSSTNLKEGVIMLIKAVKYLNMKLGIPSTIKDLNISRSEFKQAVDSLSETAMKDACTHGNPRTPDKGDISRIFKNAYNGCQKIF